MPKVVYDTEADWDAVYQVRIRDASHPQHQQKIGYSRLAMARMTEPYDDELTEFNNRVEGLTSNFAIQATDRILVAGCGLGFIIEAFKSAGFPNTFGIDNSAHVASKRGVEADSGTVFIEDDIKGGGRVKAALRRDTGDDIFDWVISESVLESYEDAEIGQLLDAAEVVLNPVKPKTNIIHMVLTVESQVDPMFNQKTLTEWVAVRNTHSWFDYVRGEVG